ncbi:TonB-dependent receptor [Sphingomonas sp. UNC305MFCol5.2]|uniref:TonB-dependent receptor n=1 Tax=Sphingomonas sp. UNC305MFCol5.2 TaxID=1449076 RepID=UPI0004A74EAD|nr:TonB-dependent receptor [Sphingomonas sp. UNC305MFCol5.2]
MRIRPNSLHATASILALAIAVSVAAPAAAQDTGGQQDQEAQSNDQANDEIVVTAQFREQKLQDAPLAITALSGEMLEARGQTSIADVGNQAPNVTLRQAPATYGPAVVAYIRGVGQRDTSFALEPGVGLYIDDVYLPTMHGSLLDLIDLDRVEILRGPQGTLAGQNSIGGAIKLYSKKPDGNGGGYFQATYGSYNRVELRGAANFTILPNQLFARVSGTAVHKDGYVTRYDYACTHPGTPIPSSVTNNKGCKLGTEGGKDYVAGRLALRYQPSDNVTLDIVGDMTQDESESGPTTLLYVGQNANPGVTNTGSATTGPSAAAYTMKGVRYGTSTGSQFISYSPYGNYAQDSFSNSPYVSYENYLELAPRDGSGPWAAPIKSAIDSWGVSANLTVDLSPDFSFTSITAYRKFNGVYASADGSPFSPTLQANRIWNRQFSQELRLNGRVGPSFNFTVGGYYLHKRSENISRVTLPTLNFIEDNEIPATTKAVFANADWEVLAGLHLVGGIRYTDLEKSFIYGRKGIPGSSSGGATPPSIASIDGLVGTFSGDRVDWRGVIQYRWSDQLMTYAQVSTGFKSGGVNPRVFFPAQALPFGPEKLTAYEAGFKSDFLDRKVRLNVSGFLNKYDDILVTVASCPLPGAPATPCALPLNAGKADVKGGEAELTLRPLKGVAIDAALAYLDFKYTAISAAAATSGIGLEDKGQYISPWQWNIGAQYEHVFASGATLTPRIDVNHQDTFNRNANNVDAVTGGKDIFGQVEGRTLVNARLALRMPDDAWEFALEGRNLTDKLYYSDVFDNRGSTNSIQGSVGEPRTWAVTVKRRFK